MLFEGFIEDQEKYRIEISANVALERGELDPGFTSSIRLSATELAVSSSSLGQELIIHYSSTRDGFVNLFRLWGDSVDVMLPNPLMVDNNYTAGTEAQFPPETWRRRGVRLRAELPVGHSRSSEGVLAVFTTKNLTPVGLDRSPTIRDGKLQNISSLSWLELQRWLLSLDRGIRSISFAPYRVLASDQ